MAEDMEYMHKALLTMLPDDEHGRPVVSWDRIRSTSDVFHGFLLYEYVST